MKMKKGSSGSRVSRKDRERQRVLDDFYTKQMKNGKTTRADILDKITMGIVVLILLIFVLNKLKIGTLSYKNGIV